VILFIKLGLWQYHKAMHKQAIEDAYQASKELQEINLLEHLHDLKPLTFKSVRVIGKYEPLYQILIDNQVDNNQAGFHVITPFKISGTKLYILVNRGWVKGYDQHTVVPTIDTPLNEHEIHGMLWEPSNKIFSLEKKPEVGNLKFDYVWQHLDIKKYQKVVPLKVLSSIVKLDPNQATGGFVRNWQLPPSRIATNLGYAYQWFGFAIATIAIFGYLSIKRVTKENE
jgi:surfeit locus 1 family protein